MWGRRLEVVSGCGGRRLRSDGTAIMHLYGESYRYSQLLRTQGVLSCCYRIVW